MSNRYEVATLNGKKVLLVGGSVIRTRAQVSQDIANLDNQLTQVLPGRLAALDAQKLLKIEQDRVNAQIADAAATKAALVAVVSQLDE